MFIILFKVEAGVIVVKFSCKKSIEKTPSCGVGHHPT